MNDYQELIKWGLEIFAALSKFGPLGMASVFLMLAIRFYQTDGLQAMLPSWARWSNLSPMVKVLIPVGGSLLAACLAMLGGASASLILPLAAVVAGGSILGHHVTKAVGSAMYDAELKKNPFYEPGSVRRIASIVVPLPKVTDKLLDKTP